MMGFAKDQLIREEECRRICPQCDLDTLWIEYGAAICKNNDCDFGDKAENWEDCINDCKRVVLKTGEELMCDECLEDAVNRMD